MHDERQRYYASSFIFSGMDILPICMKTYFVLRIYIDRRVLSATAVAIIHEERRENGEFWTLFERTSGSEFVQNPILFEQVYMIACREDFNSPVNINIQ